MFWTAAWGCSQFFICLHCFVGRHSLLPPLSYVRCARVSAKLSARWLEVPTFFIAATQLCQVCLVLCPPPHPLQQGHFRSLPCSAWHGTGQPLHGAKVPGWALLLRRPSGRQGVDFGGVHDFEYEPHHQIIGTGVIWHTPTEGAADLHRHCNSIPLGHAPRTEDMIQAVVNICQPRAVFTQGFLCPCLPAARLGMGLECFSTPGCQKLCDPMSWNPACRHPTRQLQDNYKTTTRQPTRQPTRQLQTWCKSSIWHCAF